MVGFPLLLIPIAIFNIVAFLMPGLKVEDALFSVRLLSGESWQVTGSDILIGLGVLLLLLEVIKGTRPGIKYLTDHLLSLLVFGGAAAEFLLLAKFASSTFFLLTLLALVDFLSGLALRTLRRQAAAAMAEVPKVTTASAAAEVPAIAEPAPAKAPAEPLELTPSGSKAASEGEVPAAASIAESVLMEGATPKTAQPAPAR